MSFNIQSVSSGLTAPKGDIFSSSLQSKNQFFELLFNAAGKIGVQGATMRMPNGDEIKLDTSEGIQAFSMYSNWLNTISSFVDELLSNVKSIENDLYGKF